MVQLWCTQFSESATTLPRNIQAPPGRSGRPAPFFRKAETGASAGRSRLGNGVGPGGRVAGLEAVGEDELVRGDDVDANDEAELVELDFHLSVEELLSLGRSQRTGLGLAGSDVRTLADDSAGCVERSNRVHGDRSGAGPVSEIPYELEFVTRVLVRVVRAKLDRRC